MTCEVFDEYNDPDKILENVRLLLHAEDCIHLLNIIDHNKEISKRELIQHIDRSKTALKQDLDLLESRGWIQYSNQKYCITPIGEIILKDISTLLEKIE